MPDISKIKLLDGTICDIKDANAIKTSKAAEPDGTALSLVTTGEKAIWNAKTSNAGTVTGIMMNGVSKGTSGIVDLGTVITAVEDGSLTKSKLNGTLKALLSVATNVEYLGVSSEDAPNVALQKINDIIENSDYNLMVIPPSIDYGYKCGITRPNTSLAQHRLIIFDFSRDESHGTDEADGYQAMNMRIWMRTAPNENGGQHNGDGIQINAATHPHIVLSANQQGDEWISKRASLFFASNDIIGWQLGQGIYSDDEDFQITRLNGNNAEVVFSVQKATGQICIGGHTFGFPISILKEPVIIRNDGRYVVVKDSATASAKFMLEKQGYVYGERTYFNGTKVRESIYDGGQVDKFYRNGQELQVGFHTSKGFTVSDVGANTELFTLAKTGFFKYGVSGNYYKTANRPTVTELGTMIYDQTIGKPIWWNGTGWIDAMGNSV